MVRLRPIGGTSRPSSMYDTEGLCPKFMRTHVSLATCTSSAAARNSCHLSEVEKGTKEIKIKQERIAEDVAGHGEAMPMSGGSVQAPDAPAKQPARMPM